MTAIHRPDIVVLMTDEARAVPPYESPELVAWRDQTSRGRRWFEQHGVSFRRHYAGSLACAPSRPTMFTGHYPTTRTEKCWPPTTVTVSLMLSPCSVTSPPIPLPAPPPRRRSGRAASVPVGGQFRQSARHRAVPGLAASQPGKAVTAGSAARAPDHGDLLGAHGGLHQKWFNLYDEVTRVPFVIARIGERATSHRVVTAPTSHVDLVPTLLGAAGTDITAVAAALAESFSEVHPLPGRDLMPVVDGASADDTRAVYLMTRDNILDGDSGASVAARRLKRTANPPGPLRIRVPARVGSNFEGLVVRADDVPGGEGHLWKRVRTFDDPATWTEPGVRHLTVNGPGRQTYRMSPLDDQWEMYDLTADPTESRNLWTDPGLQDLRQHLRTQLKHARAGSVPERNRPWPYASRRQPTTQRSIPARLSRWLLEHARSYRG